MKGKPKKPKGVSPLSEMDLVLLSEAVTPGAEKEEIDLARKRLEEKTAFTLIKQSQFKALAQASSKGRKRGPKSAASKNVTEDEERQRLGTLRQMLGKQGKSLKKPKLLFVALNLLSEFKRLCDNGLFLRSDEFAVLHVSAPHRMEMAPKLAAAIQNAEYAFDSTLVGFPSPSDLVEWCQELEESYWERGERRGWRLLVDDALAACKQSNTAKSTDKSDLYGQLGIALDLDLDVENVEQRKRLATDPEAKLNEVDQADILPMESLRDMYPKPTVPETLKAVTAGLVLLRHIADNCVFFPVTLGIESLYLLVHSLSLANPPGSLPAFVSELEGVFMKILQRQRRSPLPILANEELRFGPSMIPDDGQDGVF